jgi:hypothetical protein
LFRSPPLQQRFVFFAPDAWVLRGIEGAESLSVRPWRIANDRAAGADRAFTFVSRRPVLGARLGDSDPSLRSDVTAALTLGTLMGTLESYHLKK